MKKGFVAILAAGAAVLLTAGTRLGGWAIVSVENPPDYFIAGKATELTFVVRQHAVKPLNDLRPTIEAHSGAQSVKGMTWSLGRPGAYGARITVPGTGQWRLTINSGFGRSRGILLPVEAIESSARTPAALQQPERGRRLFAARGCVTCHVHGDVEIDGDLKSFGPELTGRRFPREYLAQFLANPALKPPTNGRDQMPNPQLNASEIASLVAFINGERRVVSR